jgi:uncharacterized protein YfaS (alpha-2-macroglobulin family)
MDKKRRIGKTVKVVRSFKPVMAQLSTPQFLIEGDVVQLTGKVFNYTTDNYDLKTSFFVQNNLIKEQQVAIASNASSISALSVETPFTDTVKARFQLLSTTGFKDGEERKIPVFKKGTEENIGQFWIVQNDTAIHFKADERAASIEISAVNNTLDILLDELDHLKKYPYFCMEQTASKLRGLIMERKIRLALKQPFKSEKELNQLVQKLQGAQHFDGSWSWWDAGRPNIYITNYVLNALLPLRENGLVETNIRNGLLYLNNQLKYLSKPDLLAALETMATANHVMDYTPYLQKIDFDSLSMHQQWQLVSIKQQLKLNYANELDSLLKKAKYGILGSVHWGDDNYRWYSNKTATSVLAYEVIGREEKHKSLKQQMIQYFLEERKNGYWINTVASAGILSAILPDVLAINNQFDKPTELLFKGDTAFAINKFPFVKKLNSNIKSLQITKNGGGLTYLSLYQKLWNRQPDAVKYNFDVRTYFEKNGQTLSYIKSGERMKMIVTVNVKKEAEYVMIEIPIPAGCTYASKKQDAWDMRKEFMKNKVIMFTEFLSIGEHRFEIELEPRYNGMFTLNPAKVELMYFPVFLWKK